jgi:hypothetical protein
VAELVGVHGIGRQQRSRPQLLPEWVRAVHGGLEAAVGGRELPVPDVGLAFYGDLFRRDADTTGAKAAADEVVLDGLAGAELVEVTAALKEAVTAEDISVVEGEQAKGYTRVPAGLGVLLAAVDRRFGWAAGVLYVGVLRQVYRYLHDREVKTAVDRQVVEAVGPDCRVLVGHSLGSIVAYEYLRTRPDHQVVLFVTVGSPLGLRMVRDRITVGHLRVPVWRNVRDVRDPVACAGPLDPWWPQLGPAGDIVVDNGGDAHAVDRYLNRKATGRLLLDALPHWAVP